MTKQTDLNKAYRDGFKDGVDMAMEQMMKPILIRPPIEQNPFIDPPFYTTSQTDYSAEDFAGWDINIEKGKDGKPQHNQDS